MSPTASGQSKFIFVKFFFFYFTKTILTFRCLEANGSASSAIQNRRPRRRRPARKPIESASRPSAQPSWRRTKSLQKRAKRLAQPPQRLRWRHHRLADLPPPWLSNAASTRPSPRRRTLRPAGIKVNPFFHFFFSFFCFFFLSPHKLRAKTDIRVSFFFVSQDDPRPIRKSRRSLAFPTARQHQTISHVQENHPKSNGSEHNPQETQRRHVSLLNLKKL